jgi:hypothetical protein
VKGELKVMMVKEWRAGDLLLCYICRYCNNDMMKVLEVKI